MVNFFNQSKFLERSIKFFTVSFICVFLDLFAVSFWDMEPLKVRELINQKAFAIEAECLPVQNSYDIFIKCDERITPLRIYIPNKRKELPLVLFIHGGGWVAGSLDTHDNMARYLCNKAEAVVVSVGYTNSPEGKFPLPLEQCYDALLWAIENVRELQIDPSHIAVVGDSAGGNMAAALCLLTRDREGPKIDLQILINPSLDLTGKGTLKPQGDSQDQLRWFALQYVKNPSDVNHPYVSPLLAKKLHDLPAALIILAENDDLYEQGKQYGERLLSDGVDTQIYTQLGVGHLAGHGARASTLAQPLLDAAVKALIHHFKTQTKRSLKESGSDQRLHSLKH